MTDAEVRTVALYIRVSTDDQATNGVSLEAQEERLLAYCVARGWEPSGIYRDEGQSAKTLERPALQQLLKDAKAKKFQAVLVFNLSRLTRSVHDLGTLLGLFEKYDVAPVSLSESLDSSTAAGRLMLHLLTSVAQWERESTGERTSVALRHKRDKLQAYGTTPLGFKREGDNLVPVAHEVKQVREIFRYRRGGVSYQAIADLLNERKIKSKNDKRWSAQTIWYICKNTDLYARFLTMDSTGAAQ